MTRAKTVDEIVSELNVPPLSEEWYGMGAADRMVAEAIYAKSGVRAWRDPYYTDGEGKDFLRYLEGVLDSEQD